MDKAIFISDSLRRHSKTTCDYTFETNLNFRENNFREVFSLNTIYHILHVLFNVSFIGFVDASVMSIAKISPKPQPNLSWGLIFPSSAPVPASALAERVLVPANPG